MTWITNLELLPRFNIADVEKWADEGCRIPRAVLLKKIYIYLFLFYLYIYIYIQINRKAMK